MINRAAFVVNTTLDFIQRNVTSFPVDLFAIASENNIKVMSLTEHLSLGLTEEQAFELWGNDDGAAMFIRGRLVIGYNDRKPERRIRFTLAHEIMHIVLCHFLDTQVDEFSPGFRPEVLDEYEQEANLAAGLLLCNPKVCYSLRSALTEQSLQRLFGVSYDCAVHVLNDLHEYKSLIHKSSAYRKMRLPELDPAFVLPDSWIFDRFVEVWPTAAEWERL